MKHILNSNDVIDSQEYTEGFSYYLKKHIFTFPLPTPIYSCKQEVSEQTTKGAMGE